MNEELAGLAAMGQPRGKAPEMTVKEVVALLQQGATPEELIQMGVQPAVIEQAVMILSQQATAVPNEGLAGMKLQGGM